MPDGRDYNTRRPPRRKSWDEEDSADQNSDDDNWNGIPSQRINRVQKAEAEASADANAGESEKTTRPKSRVSRRGPAGDRDQLRDDKGNPIQSVGSGWGGKKEGAEEDEKKARSKYNQKRLFKMLGSQALCLGIIFGLISAFNWMAADYSGDYMGQSGELRMVRLSITRRATTVDADLSYGQQGALQLDQSKDHPSPQADKPISLDFVTPEQWRRPGKKIWHANFKGRIKDGTATGTIIDSTGIYKVTMEKNVLTSLFTQLQSHIPNFPSVPLPSLFNEKEQRQHAGVAPSKDAGNQGTEGFGPLPPSQGKGAR
jgi:hypothetical protein